MTDFKGYKLEKSETSFLHTPSFSDIYSDKYPLNIAQHDCQKTDATRIDQGNFFALRFRISYTWYVKDIETLTDKVDKLELAGDYVFIVATNNGILFNNTASQEHAECMEVLVKRCYDEMGKYAESAKIKGMFPMPSSNEISSLSRSLGISRAD